MKSTLFFLSLVVFSKFSVAQTCDPDNKYDKIVSGYHSSVAQTSTGALVGWGQDMQVNGTGDVLVPQLINSTNYPAIGSSTPLLASIGGGNSSSTQQAVLLTTDGLYAWGNTGGIFSTTLRSAASMAKLADAITSDNTFRLPNIGGVNVTPDSVKMLVAAFQTLAILTKGGRVYVLSQVTNAAIRGAGAIATPSATTWYQVQTSAGNPLLNVTAIRLQVSDATHNAFIALTSNGSVFTWGSSTFLGNNTAVASRNFATQMTLPAEFNSTNIPAMIAVTGGISSSAATNNTYFLLSKSGALYSLGDNSQRQCGTFATTATYTQWQNVKINATTNFSNVKSITAQEHNSSFPCVAVTTSTGMLYNWGSNNARYMLGRTTTGIDYDPGIPNGFNTSTDFAVTAEFGGHTFLYVKPTGALCYVGHKVSGSMGDGSTLDTDEVQLSCISPAVTFCATLLSTLPLNWVNVNAYRNAGGEIKLMWETANEQNVNGFVVERSENGTGYQAVSSIISAHNQPMNSYAFTDRSGINGKMYYRIKQTDNDGKYTYSKVLIVPAFTGSNNKAVIVYPTPASNQFYIKPNVQQPVQLVQLLDVNGSVLREWKFLQSSYDIQGISNGQYLVKITFQSGQTEFARITIL